MFPIKIKRKAEKVFKYCIKKKIKMSFAESCTGGLLSSLITSFPNSSKIFIGGFITYSDLSKQKMIGVKTKTLKKHRSHSRIFGEIKIGFGSNVARECESGGCWLGCC